MWTPAGNEIAQDALGVLAPTDVLFEFEEPLTFACRDRDGQLLLAHSLCAEGMLSRYLIVVTDERVIAELKAGRLDVLGALRQPRCWIADFGPEWEVKNLWSIPFDKVPVDVLPKPWAMLTPELEPLLRLRLIGTGVGPGKTSAADVRMAAQSAESSLRGLARIALTVQTRAGRPAHEVRYYSNPPFLSCRAASFEIAFGRPEERRLLPQDEEVFAEMGRLLERGLEILRKEDGRIRSEKHPESDEEIQLFEAIKSLTPPTRGGVDRIEVGGRLVEQLPSSAVLTRDDRRKVVERIKASRKAPRQVIHFRVMGVIPEADQDAFTFTLREFDSSDLPDIGTLTEISFQFEDRLYEDVMDAFNSREQVVVFGVKIGSDFQALDIQSPAAESSDDAGPASLPSE